jgi:hypothetical protein
MTKNDPTPIGKDFNPGGARWCLDHQRLECTRQKRGGRGPCHAAAIRGMPDCELHVGIRREVARNQGEARITAWSAIGDTSKTISPSSAVLGVLHMSWLRLAAYGELLRKQVTENVAGDAPGTGADQGEDPFYGPDGEPRVDGAGAGDGETAGLIGHRYAMGGQEGTLYRQAEEVRALVQLEATERDRVVRYAKTAHDMGISDKMVQLAERWGDVVAGRVSEMLIALELTPEQQARVPILVESYLGTIDMTETDGQQS